MAAASADNSDKSENAKYDYSRLHRAVESLLKAHDRLRLENDELREAVEQRDARVLDLEGALRDQQHRRTDAIARIDTLVAQLEDLDGRLERAEETASPEPAGTSGSVGSAAP